MYDYGGLQTKAVALVKRFGRTLTLRKRSATGSTWNPDFTETDTETKGVVTLYSTGNIDGTMIKQGDKKCLLHSEVTPDISDLIVDSGSEYEIVNVESVQPGDTSLIYKIQMRK